MRKEAQCPLKLKPGTKTSKSNANETKMPKVKLAEQEDSSMWEWPSKPTPTRKQAKWPNKAKNQEPRLPNPTPTRQKGKKWKQANSSRWDNLHNRLQREKRQTAKFHRQLFTHKKPTPYNTRQNHRIERPNQHKEKSRRKKNDDSSSNIQNIEIQKVFTKDQ